MQQCPYTINIHAQLTEDMKPQQNNPPFSIYKIGLRFVKVWFSKKGLDINCKKKLKGSSLSDVKAKNLVLLGNYLEYWISPQESNIKLIKRST